MASHRAYLPFVSSPVARKRYTSPTTAMVRPWAGVRMVGFIRSVSFKIAGSVHRPLDPAFQPVVILGAFEPIIVQPSIGLRSNTF